MYHRDLFLGQELSTVTRTDIMVILLHMRLASCIWRKGRVWKLVLLPGAVVISRCGSSSPRHPNGAPDCVRPALRLVDGAPLPLAGQPLRSVLWNTFLASAAVRILFVAYIGRRERAAVRQGMSLGPAGQHR